MTQIIALHAFRGGTGKSNLTANLAIHMAAQGKHVAIVDADLPSPGIHLLFGLDEHSLEHSLNHYLREKCSLSETVHEVTPRAMPQASGHVFLIPSSTQMGEIAHVLQQGYNVARLTRGLLELGADRQLDYLLMDTHPGLHEETLLSIAISNEVLIVLRPDRQDLQGTAMTLQVTQKLHAPKTSLLVNKVPSKYNPKEVQSQISQAFKVPVLGVLPATEEMLDFGSQGLFTLVYPQNPYTHELQRVAAALLA